MNIIATANRLLTLSERGGTDNEKEVAREKLERLLKEHGLTLDDLSEESKEWRRFHISDEFEWSILSQCAMRVLNLSNLKYRRRKKNKHVFIDLTLAEYSDISTLFSKYKQVWKEEVNDFMVAFLSKHNLFSENSESSSKDSGIDYIRIEKLRAMMRGMREIPSPLIKQLEKGD